MIISFIVPRTHIVATTQANMRLAMMLRKVQTAVISKIFCIIGTRNRTGVITTIQELSLLPNRGCKVPFAWPFFCDSKFGFESPGTCVGATSKHPHSTTPYLISEHTVGGQLGSQRQGLPTAAMLHPDNMFPMRNTNASRSWTRALPRHCLRSRLRSPRVVFGR